MAKFLRERLRDAAEYVLMVIIVLIIWVGLAVEWVLKRLRIIGNDPEA